MTMTQRDLSDVLGAISKRFYEVHRQCGDDMAIDLAPGLHYAAQMLGVAAEEMDSAERLQLSRVLGIPDAP